MTEVLKKFQCDLPVGVLDGQDQFQLKHLAENGQHHTLLIERIDLLPPLPVHADDIKLSREESEVLIERIQASSRADDDQRRLVKREVPVGVRDAVAFS